MTEETNKPEELTPDQLETMTLPEQVEALAARGLTMKQIAHCLGMARCTLYERKKRNPDVADALKRGRAKGLAVVTNALYQNAQDGNVTAQIFYLKNRSPQEWQDRREMSVKSTGKWVVNAEPLLLEDWAKEHGVDIEDAPAIEAGRE